MSAIARLAHASDAGKDLNKAAQAARAHMARFYLRSRLPVRFRRLRHNTGKARIFANALRVETLSKRRKDCKMPPNLQP
jgi:hypothetical protein